ncbi:HigA family addiction module antitoxin [Avibacterium sp. 21-599]|uniref:HigA family addiction module antitoxin n=1 Tax=Avibacterium sp. 21-599 TaxID=2911528 RepID=UPI00224758A6|nr:HigA family addiction module antitoxin [Avibacterium sp. 21-599]MCW9717327.1 HigA family addiction module antitoxin [Avibacterium sp. 21-599]
MRMFNPAHPGEVLRDIISEFKINEVADKLGVTRVTLSRILNAKTSVTPEMAMRLSKLLPNTSPNLWLNMQAQYDLWHLEQDKQFDVQPLYATNAHEATNSH